MLQQHLSRQHFPWSGSLLLRGLLPLCFCIPLKYIQQITGEKIAKALTSLYLQFLLRLSEEIVVFFKCTPIIVNTSTMFIFLRCVRYFLKS